MPAAEDLVLGVRGGVPQQVRRLIEGACLTPKESSVLGSPAWWPANNRSPSGFS